VISKITDCNFIDKNAVHVAVVGLVCVCVFGFSSSCTCFGCWWIYNVYTSNFFRFKISL